MPEQFPEAALKSHQSSTVVTAGKPIRSPNSSRVPLSHENTTGSERSSDKKLAKVSDESTLRSLYAIGLNGQGFLFCSVSKDSAVVVLKARILHPNTQLFKGFGDCV
jgi:hypothetical protein